MTTAIATIHQLIQDAEHRFARAGILAPRREAETLLAGVLGCRPLEVYLATTLTEPQVAQFERWVSDRASGIPAQYLTSHVTFCGHDFVVSPATLIPRPETELLVEAALRHGRRLLGRHFQLRLVDLGTGCGNVAVSLTKQLPPATMLAIDRSYAALTVARINAARLGVAERIAFLQGDGLTSLADHAAPHMVVANPPYLPSVDLTQLPVEVQYEPRLALDGGADGCRWLAEWLRAAAARLVPGGVAVFELGAGQRAAVTAIVRQTRRLCLVEIQPDWNDIPRVLIAERM